MMDKNTTVLSQVVQRTAHFRVARASNAPRSIFDMSFTTQSLREGDDGSFINTTLFSFDNEIINSQAYRRALAHAFARHNKDQHQGIEDSYEANLAVKQELTEQRSGKSGMGRNPFTEARWRSVGTSQRLTESSSKTIGLLENIGSKAVSDLPSLEAPPKDNIVGLKSDISPCDSDRAAVGSLKEADVQSNLQIEKQRWYAIKVLTWSESRYLNQLEGYRVGQANFLTANGMRPFLWQGSVNDVFLRVIWRNFEDIYYANRLLLYLPLQRSRASGPCLFKVCDIIRNWIEQAGHCYVHFASLYPSANHVVLTNSRVQDLLANSLVGGEYHKTLSSSTLLKGPLQRLQTYVLFFQEMLKRSGEFDSGQLCGQLEDLIKDVKSLLARCDTALSKGQKRVNMKLRSRLPYDACRVLHPDSEIKFRTRLPIVRQLVLIPYEEFDIIILVIKTPQPCVLVLRETKEGFLKVVGQVSVRDPCSGMRRAYATYSWKVIFVQI